MTIGAVFFEQKETYMEENMEDKTPRIYIGSETEYGIFADKGKGFGKDPTLEGQLIERMLDRCQELFLNESFGGTRDSFADIEEHNQIERLLAQKTWRRRAMEEERVSVVSQGALHQRRGYSGIMLANGARFYRDMTHPEYSTPETSNPLDALIAGRAGDSIVLSCKAVADEALRAGYPAGTLYIQRNNSDGHGESYGGHENYTLSPSLFTRIFETGKEYMFSEGRYSHTEYDSFSYDSAIHAILLFFAARQIIIGAGKIGSEFGKSVPYQITARSDFFSRPFSLNTTHLRGIINLRDAPYGDERQMRRLHVILADSNMSEVSLFLKFGMTGLFFMMLETGFLAEREARFFVSLHDPVKALHDVSRDITLTKKMKFLDGAELTALEVMETFSSCADAFVVKYKLPQVWHMVVDTLREALVGLGGNRIKNKVSRSLDWVMKERLLRALCRKEGLDIESPQAKQFALRYHSIEPSEAVFYTLEKRAEIMRFSTDEQVASAIKYAPRDTRAWLRGEIIKRYGPRLADVCWNSLRFVGGKHGRLEIDHPGAGGAEECGELFFGNPSPEEFLRRVEKKNLPRVSWSMAYKPWWRR